MALDLFEGMGLDVGQVVAVVLEVPEECVLAQGCACEELVVGYSFQERPSSTRPCAFGVRPPTCLKKKATFFV